MRILVHDFAGHPFQAQLSRVLAQGGHQVDHAYCGGVTTGRGDLARRGDDPVGLSFTDLSDAPFERYSPIGRVRSEARYGRLAARHLRATSPDVVLSANTPLLAQAQLWRAARQRGARRVFWVQDFLGRGTRAVLTDRSPLLGATLGRGFEQLETELLRRSDAAVVIAEDFVDELRRRGLDLASTVVENWAPLDEIELRPKDNAWSRSHGLADRSVALYSGTLGLKHDPQHLVAAAERLRGTDRLLVVITEGRGREALEVERAARDLHDNLLLLDFVDYAVLPDVLGAADVCLVLLEADAGAFSVPSKVLTYLAAGRAVVAAVPAENLAAKTIANAGAGLVVDAGCHEAFADAVRSLLDDPATSTHMGRAGRMYAEHAFDVRAIAARILDVLEAPPSEAPHLSVRRDLPSPTLMSNGAPGDTAP